MTYKPTKSGGWLAQGNGWLVHSTDRTLLATLCRQRTAQARPENTSKQGYKPFYALGEALTPI